MKEKMEQFKEDDRADFNQSGQDMKPFGSCYMNKINAQFYVHFVFNRVK